MHAIVPSAREIRENGKVLSSAEPLRLEAVAFRRRRRGDDQHRQGLLHGTGLWPLRAGCRRGNRGHVVLGFAGF
jgi:hypothetical protein